MESYLKDKQYYKFCLYGFFKNQRFFEPFLLIYFLSEGVSYVQIGTLYALREVLVHFIEIPSGVIADALGRRSTLMFSFLFYVLSFIMLGLGGSYYMFLIGMSFYSVGDGFRTGTHKAMIYDYLLSKGWQSHKVDYYGHTRSWSQMGSALSALAGAAIVLVSKEYRSIFFIATLPYLIDFFLIYSYPKSLDGEIKRINGRKLKQGFFEVYRSFSIYFKQVHLWQAMGNVSLYQGMFKAAKDYLQVIVLSLALAYPIIRAFNHEQNTAILISLVYFLLYLLGSWGSRKSKSILNRFKHSPQFLNYSLLIGVGLLFLSGALKSMDLVLVSVVLFIGLYLIQNTRKPIGTAFVADKMKNSVLATGLSVQSLIDSLMGAFFAFLLGVLTQWLGVGMGLMVLSLIVLFISSLFWLKK